MTGADGHGRIGWATIAELQEAMEEGALTAERLTALYLERIEAYDRQGPAINSVLEVNPDAMAIARSLDEERARSGARGPLHGIPVLLKDSIDTCDRMRTSAGSLALADSFAERDAFLVRRLRQAGAVLLGKTNMTEWANFMSSNMPAGYSSRGGQTLNPYGPGTCFVGGSSSGSAAAVAAGFAAAAIGTETSGSILSPAVQNAIVGIKPTVGLVSRAGVIPIAHSQDTPGPMARNVACAAAVLGAIAGSDPDDPATADSVGRVPSDYTAFLDAEGLRGARIGVPRHYYAKLDEPKLALMARAIDVLRSRGAVVVDPVEIPSATAKWGRQVLRHEFKHDLNAYLARLHPRVPVHSLRELIAFNRERAETMLRYGQDVLEWSEETSGTLREPAYLEARRRDLELATVRGIDHAMKEHRLDALLFPGAKGSDIAARAGYPSIAVPCGFVDGVPYGLTFTGMAYSEPVLIRLAYAYEQATRHRVPPVLQPWA